MADFKIVVSPVHWKIYWSDSRWRNSRSGWLHTNHYRRYRQQWFRNEPNPSRSKEAKGHYRKGCRIYPSSKRRTPKEIPSWKRDCS